MFVHVVNFWLKNSLNKDEINFFEKEVSLLARIKTIVHFNVGAPARTDRPVIDRSYSYCLLTTFNDEHLEFIKNCAHLWEKVIIYDSETI